MLLERGSVVNAADNKGKSPFMEAALWGRLNDVKGIREAQHQGSAGIGNALAYYLENIVTCYSPRQR